MRADFDLYYIIQSRKIIESCPRNAKKGSPKAMKIHITPSGALHKWRNVSKKESAGNAPFWEYDGINA